MPAGSLKGRILVVDDDPDILRATVRILARAGYEVTEASTGQEALDFATSAAPQVILLDIGLPDMDGIEVCRRMKIDPVLADIFVVHCSARQGLDDVVSDAVDAGADGYIVRPVGERELLARVRAFFRHKQTIDRLRSAERLQAEELDREMGSLQQLSTDGLPVTARSMGITPLQEGSPEVFASLVRIYGALLDSALEERIFRTDARVSPALRALADQMFDLASSPRDLTEVHCAALKKRLENESPSRSHGLLEAGRLTLLELMGDLAAAYRRHYVAARSSHKQLTASAP